MVEIWPGDGTKDESITVLSPHDDNPRVAIEKDPHVPEGAGKDWIRSSRRPPIHNVFNCVRDQENHHLWGAMTTIGAVSLNCKIIVKNIRKADLMIFCKFFLLVIDGSPRRNSAFHFRPTTRDHCHHHPFCLWFYESEIQNCVYLAMAMLNLWRIALWPPFTGWSSFIPSRPA